MSTTLEIAKLVVPAIGAAGGAWFGGKWKFTQDRRLKEWDESRVLLDELLEAMFDYTGGMAATEEMMRDSTLNLRPGPFEYPALAELRRKLHSLHARLVIRKGRDHQLVTALGQYLKAVDDAEAEIRRLWPRQEPFDYSDEQLQQRAATYWSLYEAVVDEAQKVAQAGAKV